MNVVCLPQNIKLFMKHLGLEVSVVADRLCGGVILYLGVSECFVKLRWWWGVLFTLYGLKEHLMWMGLCSTWRPNTAGTNEQWLQNVRGEICRVRTTWAEGAWDRREGHIKMVLMQLGPVTDLRKVVTCNNFSSVWVQVKEGDSPSYCGGHITGCHTGYYSKLNLWHVLTTLRTHSTVYGICWWQIF